MNCLRQFVRNDFLSKNLVICIYPHNRNLVSIRFQTWEKLGRFLKSIGFSNETLYTISIYGALKPFFRYAYSKLYREVLVYRGVVPINFERVAEKRMPFSKKGINYLFTF